MASVGTSLVIMTVSAGCTSWLVHSRCTCVNRSEYYLVASFGVCSAFTCEPGSSVSIVSGYGLDDRATEVRSPAEAKGFFL
jgi:hypothetical protein